MIFFVFPTELYFLQCFCYATSQLYCNYLERTEVMNSRLMEIIGIVGVMKVHEIFNCLSFLCFLTILKVLKDLVGSFCACCIFENAFLFSLPFFFEPLNLQP